MSTKRSKKKSDPKFIRAYDRAMLRAQFVSLFWSIIAERKKRGAFTLQGLAKALGKNKGEVSRWFSGEPNWTLNTIASLSHALDVDLRVQAVERTTGMVFTASGASAGSQGHAETTGQIVKTTAEEGQTPRLILVVSNGHKRVAPFPDEGTEAA